MDIKEHLINQVKVAEIVSDETVIKDEETGKDLLGTLYYSGYDRVIIHERNITPSFFQLKNRMAGEILQKFSNYRVRLAIVGSFDKHTGKSIQDFMYESNQGKQVNFLQSPKEALHNLSA